MSWEYRVIRHEPGPLEDEHYFGIHEVYYGDHPGDLTKAAWSAEAVRVGSDSTIGLVDELMTLKAALKKPLLATDGENLWEANV